MERKVSNNAPAPVGPYSQSVLANGVLYISGQIGIDPKTNTLVTPEEQPIQVLKNITAILSEYGMNNSNIVKVTVFVTSADMFKSINAVFTEYFDDAYPARSMVVSPSLPAGAVVEIESIAVKE